MTQTATQLNSRQIMRDAEFICSAWFCQVLLVVIIYRALTQN